jgi:hypothetical protein
MRRFCWLFFGLALTLGAAPAWASPDQEQALIEEANPHIDKVLDPASDKATKARALRELSKIRRRMKKLADQDPDFTKRSDTDEFRNMYEEMADFLAEEARELGIDLDAPASKPDKKPRTDAECSSLPLPDYSAYPDRDKDVKAVAKAYEALMRHLKTAQGDSFQDRAKWINQRDRLLENLITAQIALAWNAGGTPSATERIRLLEAKDKFAKSLQEKRAADSQEQVLINRLAELHRLFNRSKRDWAENGKAQPNLLQLEAEAQRVIKKIMALRSTSNKAYQDYVTVARPMEKEARALFDKQLERGVEAINFKLGQQGRGKRPFTLFRPKTGHERDLLNKIIGKWLIRRLGIMGASESVDWVDWDKFTDFDFSTGGAPDGKCDKPEKRPYPQPNKPYSESHYDNPYSESGAANPYGDNEVAAPTVAKPEKPEVVCQGGGLIGNVNCVTRRIEAQ